MCPARLRNAGYKCMMILNYTILALPGYEAVGSSLDIGGVVFAVVGFLQFCGLTVQEEAAVLCRHKGTRISTESCRSGSAYLLQI